MHKIHFVFQITFLRMFLSGWIIYLKHKKIFKNFEFDSDQSYSLGGYFQMLSLYFCLFCYPK